MRRQVPREGIDALAERLRRGEKLQVDELLALMDALITERKGLPRPVAEVTTPSVHPKNSPIG